MIELACSSSGELCFGILARTMVVGLPSFAAVAAVWAAALSPSQACQRATGAFG